MKIEIWQHYLGNRNGKCMDIVFQKKKMHGHIFLRILGHSFLFLLRGLSRNLSLDLFIFA